jgi:hypothetical protein
MFHNVPLSENRVVHPIIIIIITLIDFPRQESLHERTSMLRYTYIVCFV